MEQLFNESILFFCSRNGSNYTVKHSCAVALVVCLIGPQGQCGGTGRAAGGTGIRKSENKGLVVCWNKENKRVWFESGGKGPGPVGGTVLTKGCLIAPNQY